MRGRVRGISCIVLRRSEKFGRVWHTSDREGENRPLVADLIAIVLLLAAGFSVLYAVWQSPNLVAYGGFAVAVVPLVTGWIAWVWRARTRSDNPAVAGENLNRSRICWRWR